MKTTGKDLVIIKVLIIIFVFSLNWIYSQSSYPPISPKWVFEPWVWEDNDNNEDSTWALIDGYLSRGIPVGAVILDSPWEAPSSTIDQGYNTFLFEPARYRNPKRFIQTLNSKGIHVILWITGVMTTNCPLYQNACNNNYFVNNCATTSFWKGSGRASHIDFFNPNAVNYWRSLMNRVFDSLEVDGWKIDESDYRIRELNPITTYGGIKTVRQYSDAYYSEIYNYTILRRGNKGMITARPYCYKGSTSYFYAPISVNTAGWVGDQENSWDGLNLALKNIFISADAGYATVGFDLGGYVDNVIPPNKNLFIRWAQLGSFVPIMENGGKTDKCHKPWLFDANTTQIYRYYAKLHHQLVPYLYSNDISAHFTKTSIFRPLGERGYPDTNSWNGDWKYLLGDNFFVSAIYEDKTSRTITFPEGSWIDYWDENNIYQGGTTKTFNYSLSQYPIFIKSGSIIPMNADDSETGHGSAYFKNYLTLLIYPSGSSSFLFYTDPSSSTLIKCKERSDGITVNFNKMTDSVVIRLKNKSEPKSIILSNRINLERKNTFSDFEKATSGWFYGKLRDGENIYTWIKFNRSTDTIYVNNSTATTTCPSTMISYWKLDETSGNTYIDQLGINNATGNLPPSPVTGQVGGAQQFNGSTAKISVPANSSFDIPANGSFSVEFWYKGSTIPSTYKAAVARYMPDIGSRWYVGFSANDGKVKFSMINGTSGVTATGTAVFNGSWHYITATRNGFSGVSKVYVDGVLRGSSTLKFTKNFSSPTANLNIGWFAYQTDYTLNGTLDEVAIYKNELSASDILLHYNNGLAGKGYCAPNGEAPVITSTPVTKAITHQLYSYNVDASGDPVPSYSLVTSPQSMTINTSTGLIQWTPSSSGNYNVTVEAHNGINPPAQQSFVISVVLTSPYPKSNYITGITYNWTTHISLAPGSDNWPITWADDNNQYSAWGDGGGFGGTNEAGRVSLGVARIEGLGSAYTGYNVWGGYNAEHPANVDGKSRGIICVGGILYMWVGPGSYPDGFNESRLYSSTNHGATWVRNSNWAFIKSEGIIMPGFLQFGKNFANARDNYSYIYTIRYVSDTSQIPGKIDLMRVDKTQILNRSSYEFFKGFDLSGNALWTSDLTLRKPVFEDVNGVGRGLGVSVMYNPGLNKYILIVEHGLFAKGNIGVFEAPEPWGPWETISYENSFGSGHVQQSTFYWNISPKWLSSDGKDFVMIYTGIDSLDSWNTVGGSFTTNPQTYPPGLISYLKLDETSGSTYIDQLGLNNATGNLPPSPVTGRVGGAQLFNGSTTKISVPANSSLDIPANGSFSVEFWYKGSTIPSTYKAAVARYMPDIGARWYVGFSANDGRARLYMVNSSGNVSVPGTAIVDGSWHHVAATRNGSSGVSKLYVDGVLRGSAMKTFTTGFNSTTANLNIGWFAFQNDYTLNGTLDEIAIYKSELSASDILLHYNNGLNGIGYYTSGLGKQIAESETKIIPSAYTLFQNYPNPFNPVTIIRFSIPEDQRVSIKIFNQLGEEITELTNRYYNAGTYEVEFNGINLASGLYFLRMNAGNFVGTKKLVLIK